MYQENDENNDQLNSEPFSSHVKNHDVEIVI